MNKENYYSVCQINHAITVLSFTLLDETEVGKFFIWVTLHLTCFPKNFSNGAKTNQHRFLLPEFNTRRFSEFETASGT